ncbi:UNVERIFIED_CONTAM: hypothetical protein K2H54_039454 [Gekko kuhli]
MYGVSECNTLSLLVSSLGAVRRGSLAPSSPRPGNIFIAFLLASFLPHTHPVGAWPHSTKPLPPPGKFKDAMNIYPPPPAIVRPPPFLPSFRTFFSFRFIFLLWTRWTAQAPPLPPILSLFYLL